jgi:ATP dependent DNA ligase-like protein
MAKLPHSMRKAAVRSRSFRYSKSLETWPWSSNVFDLLFLEGKDLRQEPLSARRKLLTQVLKNAPENIRLSDELRGKGGSIPGRSSVWPRGLGREEKRIQSTKRPAQWCLLRSAILLDLKVRTRLNIDLKRIHKFSHFAVA